MDVSLHTLSNFRYPQYELVNDDGEIFAENVKKNSS